MARFRLPVVIQKDQDGYFASCPTLQGCYIQGDSYEELLANMQDAIRLHIADRRSSGRFIQPTEVVSFTTLEVRV